MIDSKYRNKNYLAQYDLSLNIFENFNLKVEDVIPIRNVFFLKTNKGDKVLKKIKYSVQELLFIDAAIQYIKKSFSGVMDFIKTGNGEIYIVCNGDLYCIMDLVEGRECEFANPVDLKIAAIGLGALHKASEGFKYNLNNRCSCGKLIGKFKRRIEEMMFFINIANLHDRKNEFDTIFLSNVQYNINEIQRAIELLERLPYYRMCSEEERVVVCHHDLAHHNILVKDEKAYFIDFDYAMIDLKVHDLCNFINRAVKNASFDIEKANLVLESYSKSNSLDKKEMQVLQALLTFPDDFYSISRDYYTKRKDWEAETFLERLKAKVQYREDREEFLGQFGKLI